MTSKCCSAAAVLITHNHWYLACCRHWSPSLINNKQPLNSHHRFNLRFQRTRRQVDHFYIAWYRMLHMGLSGHISDMRTVIYLMHWILLVADPLLNMF